MKPDHPFLEPTAIGVHVLHVVNLADHLDSCDQIDRTLGDANFANRCAQRPAAVGAKHRIRGQQQLVLYATFNQCADSLMCSIFCRRFTKTLL